MGFKTSCLGYAMSILTQIDTCFSLIVLLCLFFGLCIYFCWYYWRLIQVYKEFPSERMDLKWLFRIMTGRYPKDVPFTSLIFQEIIKIGKKFEKNGICVVWFIRPYVVLLNDEFVKAFSNEPALLNKSFLYNILKDELGNGLITSDSQSWKVHRKIMNPLFSTGMLKGKMHLFNACAADLVQDLGNYKGKPMVDILEHLKNCTFNIMAESVLGLKLKEDKYAPRIKKYHKFLSSVSDVFICRILRPWLYWKFLLPIFSSGRRYLKEYDGFHNFTNEMIIEMKNSGIASEAMEQNSGSDVENRKSLTHILLEQHLKDPTFTIKNVQDNVTTFMAAAHDTTTYTLFFCLYLLGRHPEIQEKAFIEASSITGRDITHGDLYRLSYIECVIKETLRLYTIAPVFGRKLSKEIQYGKYTFPKGAEIGFFSYMLHKNPNVYPDPTKFDPDRFSESSSIRPWMYIPFAEGLRNCIGKKFAIMEMKVVLVHILRNFQIKSLDILEETDISWSIILKPVKPIPMIFTPRTFHITSSSALVTSEL